jgi:hypothetical protein
MSTKTATITDAPSVTAPIIGEPGAFNYWSKTESPSNTEYIFKISNGTSPDLVPVSTTVRDIRSIDASHFNIDSHGFQVLHHASSLLPPQAPLVADFSDQALMRNVYWPETVELVKTQLGARAAVAINTTVRDIAPRTLERLSADNPRANPRASLEPFFFVHGDYTAPGARGHLRAMLPSFFEDNGCMEGTTAEEREHFFRLKHEILHSEDTAMDADGVTDPWQWSGRNYEGPRWAMLSVWRPLETVQRDPLGLMDPNTLFNGSSHSETVVPLPRIYKNRPGFEGEYKSENLLPLPPTQGKKHDWYYTSEQRPEEVYAIKLFDSEAYKEGSTVVPYAAHSAFALRAQETKPLRRSAEVRVLVIW